MRRHRLRVLRVGDVAGGYGNDWRDILEFRKTVGAAATVRVQADLVYDSEPGYDFTTLQRRTAANPDFEPITGGQGLSWDGVGAAAVDYTFTYTPGRAVSKAPTSRSPSSSTRTAAGPTATACGRPNGAARLDNITVTVNGDAYGEDFEDGIIGPDWSATPNVGVGDFARVWGLLGDADDCASNYSKLIAFIDDGLVVPGTGGTVGGPGNDYGPPGGYIVNNTGGLLGPDVPPPELGVLAGDDLAGSGHGRHDARVRRLPPRTADRQRHPGHLLHVGRPLDLVGDITIELAVAGPQLRVLRRPGLPAFGQHRRRPGGRRRHQVQVTLGVYELGWQFGYGDGTNGTPAPYFDNVSVKVYPTGGPRIAVTRDPPGERRLPRDRRHRPGQPGRELGPLRHGRQHLGADAPAERPGRLDLDRRRHRAPAARWSMPVMHWTFARRNPLFDAYRSLPASPVGRQR